MVEIFNEHLTSAKDTELLEKVSSILFVIADSLSCTNEDCQEKHLIAIVGANALAMQGVTLRYVCHIEYLDTLNNNLPNWLQLEVDHASLGEKRKFSSARRS